METQNISYMSSGRSFIILSSRHASNIDLNRWPDHIEAKLDQGPAWPGTLADRIPIITGT